MTKENKEQELSESTEPVIAYSTCPVQFFRYEWQEYAEHDYDGELVVPRFPNIKLELRKYDLIKETSKGYWIGYEEVSFKKWIPKISKKRYAYPTKEEALRNFILRTEKRIKILQREVACCNTAISLAKKVVLLK